MQQRRLTSTTFNDEMSMRASARNWEYGTIYTLLPDSIEGEHHVLMLPHMQLSFTDTKGGQLRSVASPPGTLSVAAVLRCEGNACFGNTKFKEGDIVIFDDTRERLFFTPARHRIAIVSFPKKTYRKLSRIFGKFNDHVIDDAATELGETLEAVLAYYKEDPKRCENEASLRDDEKRLASLLTELLDYRLPYAPKLTRGEKIALEIRDRVYAHIEPDISINNFAKEYGVTEQTLQNAFKSLFGMTPHKFLRNLKLNHVRKELLHADPRDTTVIAVANKWGFTHMGHFSGYYTRLFGENPSVTLQCCYTDIPQKEALQA